MAIVDQKIWAQKPQIGPPVYVNLASADQRHVATILSCCFEAQSHDAEYEEEVYLDDDDDPMLDN